MSEFLLFEKIYPNCINLQAAVQFLCNVLYYVLLLLSPKICSELPRNYNPSKITAIIAGPLPGNPLEFLFWKGCNRRNISPSAYPIHISSIWNWPLVYIHSSLNRPLVWLITDVLMASALKIIALEKGVYGFSNMLWFVLFQKPVAVPFSFFNLFCIA